MTFCTLALQFDINQATRSLQYSFSNTEKKTGAWAGTFNFNNSGDPKKQDILEVDLTVTGEAKGTDGQPPRVYVKDCTLVSVSNGKVGQTYLSPFSKDKAVSRITGFPKELEGTVKKGRIQFSAKGKPLTVKAQTGQWQISGFLSIELRLDGKTYNRVFTFDPEGSSGAGQLFP